jgi:mono/diheme cytochrome c family protein
LTRHSLGVAVLASVLAAATWTANVAAQGRGKPAAPRAAGADQQRADGATLKNPVKRTAASTAAGKTLYDVQCSSCHGTTGKGDGKMAVALKPPKPSDLSDASWKHGSTDGEIFAMIRDGSKGTSMRGYAGRIKTEDIWNVVNYLRTLAAQPPKSH